MGSLERPSALAFERFAFSYPSLGEEREDASECPLAVSAESTSPMLGSVDWRVSEGEFVLLVGDTGSGKTTLLRQFKPEIAPVGKRSGSVRVFGQDASALDGESARLVGYVAQSPENQLVCESVWHEMAFGLENLGVQSDLMRRRVAEIAHFFGIEPWFHAAVDSLSGGQQQLLNLAKTLAICPRLLLLDEPTAQLDPVAEREFAHALFRVNRELGITIVVATHAPEVFAGYATACACLREGCVEEASLEDYAPRLVESAWVLGETVRGMGLSCDEDPSHGVKSCDVELSRDMEASHGEEALQVMKQSHGAKGCDVDPPRGARPSRAAKSRAAKGREASALRLDDVYVRYGRKERFVLAGADVRMERGTIHAIVGGNGSGKSTLLATLAGVLRCERGKVMNALSRSQVLLPQDPKALFACDTVLDELMEWSASCGYGKSEALAAIEGHFLAGSERRHPYDLSGGQRQLLALAKLMLAKPQLMLLDEPTKGLDFQAKAQVANTLLRAVQSGVTVVLATHDLSFAARVADEVSLLFDGQIACTQSAEDFFAQNLFYRPLNDRFYREWSRGPSSLEESVVAGEEGKAGAVSSEDGGVHEIR